MKKYVICCVMAIGFISADWVKVLGISETALPSKKVVVASDTISAFVRTENFGFIRNDTTTNGTNFQRIEIPDEPIDNDTVNIGRPQIPYVRLLIAVPDSSEFAVTVYGSDYLRFEGYQIYPVPRIVYESDTAGYVAPAEVFTYDTLFYEKDTMYPGKLYEIRSDGYWRDQRVLEVFLYPIQLNPQRQLLYFYNYLDLRIEYLGEVVANANGLGPFEKIGQELLLNYPGINPYSFSQPDTMAVPTVHYYTELLDSNNRADYIIVTQGDFLTLPTDSVYEPPFAAQLISDFAQWRVFHNRFEVGVVKMEDIYEQFPDSLPDSAAVLKEFLIYAYENWTAPNMTDGHFAYCLFIGDWEYVPVRLGMNGHVDESYYRHLISVDCEDIMLGRWPVKIDSTHHSEELATISRKTINYEKYPLLGDWRRKGLLIAGSYEGRWEGYLDTSRFYFTDIDYDTNTVRQIGLTAQEFRDGIANYLNDEGAILAAYWDHGAPYGWYNYDTTEVKGLTNGSRLPVVLSFACLTALFYYDHPDYGGGLCFGEHFLFNPYGGCVAFHGSTTLTSAPGSLNAQILERTLRDQEWILGLSLLSLDYGLYGQHGFCLLGDPALDLGDYTAYPSTSDLVVRPQGIDISMLSPYPYLKDTDSLPIQVSIWNIGGATAHNVQVEISVKLPAESEVIIDEITIPEIAPRDSVVVVAYWNVAEQYPDYYGEIGDCDFVVKVDPDNEITESWEYNNATDVVKKVAVYPYQSGWPKEIVGCKQPAIADLDGNGSVEVVCSGLDSVYIFDKDGNAFQNWPKYFKWVQDVVLGDINNDKKIEIVATSTSDTVRVYNWQGNLLWAHEVPDWEGRNCDIIRPPCLGRIADASSPV